MKRLVLPVSLLLIVVSRWTAAQEVIVSRRVYTPAGTSFHQLWVWSPDTAAFEQLTRAPRDHRDPSCAADGTAIDFSSGDRRLRFERGTATEIAVDDAPPAAPIGRRAGERIEVFGCDAGTASPAHDTSRVACAVHGEAIAVVEVRTQRELERAPFNQHSPGGYPYPPWPLQSTWAPDDARLLVGTYGYGSSSTSSFLDYFVLDLATRQWTRAFSGNYAAWLEGGRRIVFTTPRDLAPLPGTTKHVWTTQLAVFDLGTGVVTALTSDVANNEEVTVCPTR
jgi:hypothetical protein